MVSMSEFLSGFTYHGEPVIQSGAIDPTRQRSGLKPVGTFGVGGGGGVANPGLSEILPFLEGMSPEQVAAVLEQFGSINPAGGAAGGGSLTLDPNDFVFGGPEIFARLLQTGELDGGFLSDVTQNKQFAAETSGLMGLLGGANRQRSRGAAQSNLNPIFASRQNLESEFGVLSQILGRRAQLGSELEERRFGAQQAFANMLAQTTAAEKQFRVNTQAALGGAQIGAQGAIAGGQAQGSGTSKAGMFGLFGSVLGAAI